MALHDLDEGAWSVVVGGRTLTLRPFSASDMVAKEREQLELRATDDEWRRYMPLHWAQWVLWRAALKHQPDLTIEQVGDLMVADDHGSDWWAETIGRCLGGATTAPEAEAEPEESETPATQ